MKLHTTISISTAELLEYITDVINKQNRYSSRYDLATGEAKEIRPPIKDLTDEWVIEWGEKPERIPVPAPETVPTETQAA